MGKQIRSDAYTGAVPEEPNKKEHDPTANADFENLLKTDPSGEAPDQGKKKKTEEEEEKKKETTPETEVPTSEAFQRFMSEKDSDDSPFGVKSPQGVQGISSTEGTEHVPKTSKKQKKGRTTEEMVATPQPEQELVYVPQPEKPSAEAKTEPAPAPKPAPAPAPAAKKATPTPTPAPAPTPTPAPSAKQATPHYTGGKTPEPAPAPAPTPAPSPTPSPAPAPESSTTTATLAPAPAEESTTTTMGEPPTTETVPDLPGDTPNTLEKALEEAAPLPTAPEAGMIVEGEGLITKPTGPEGKIQAEEFPINAIKKKSRAGEITPTRPVQIEGGTKKTDRDTYMAEIGAFPEGTTPTVLPEAPLPPEAPSPYTGLSKQVRSLFDYMVGTIIVKKDTHETTTTVTVNLKGSVFDGSKIVLTRYATAPDALNVQLQGDPKAVSLFTENLDALRQTFVEKKFNVHLQSPILLDEYFKKRKKAAKTVTRKGKKD